MEKIKVLYILPSLSKVNGISSYVMNYYRNLDRDKIKCDFLTLHNRENYYKSEIENNNDGVFEITLEDSKNIFEFIKKIKFFIKEHNYDIIHCNVINLGVFILYFAKKYNIKTRILHVHATQTGENVFKKIRNDLILYFAKIFSNQYFACSNAAGIAMFKNKKFQVINNAIDEKEFLYNEDYRKEIREELSIKDDEVLLGNIGRICEQKNQKFLLKLLNDLNKKEKKYKLIMVGTGLLEEEIIAETKKMKLEKSIIFLGNRSDVYKIYSAIDILLLPSLYEGLPVVGIEAQCNGVPCLFSNTITDEVKINDNVKFLTIDTNEEWIEFLEKSKYTRNIKNCFYNSDYDIKKQTFKLEEIYKALRDGEKNEY